MGHGTAAWGMRHDAAACGIPDKIYGEEVICFVVLREGSELSERSVIKHCGELLAPFKTPKSVFFVDKLPKNERGKLDRKVLTMEWKRSQAGTP